ncbi:diguanylate cyclase [Magnetococcales bacterium HHB-1]
MSHSMEKSDVLAKLQNLRLNYIEKLPEKIAEIEQAWWNLQGDLWQPSHLESLHRLLHALVGAAATFGLSEVSTQARLVETAVKSFTGEVRKPALHRLEKVHKGLLTLKRMISKGSDTCFKESAFVPKPVISSRQRSKQTLLTDPLIYVVEPDEALGLEMRQQLKAYGFSVDYQPTLAGFIEAVNATEPALVIMDMQLLEGEGASKVCALQKKRARSLPMIFTSASDDMDRRLRAVRCGGIDFFQKPVDMMRLVDRLDLCISSGEEESYRVLIVEDEMMLAEYYALVLGEHNIETSIVTDPMTILHTLNRFSPDLILMDLYMPGCSGLEAAQIIRQQPSFVTIPITYLSGEQDVGRKLSALNIGGDGFITKPVDPDHLFLSVVSQIKRARKLRSLMVRDGLTGLLNHTTTRERLAQEVKRALREGGSFAFAMVDIDHFKSVNDTYGHSMGDRVIKSLARLLGRRLRSTDVIGRFGGEEFGIILNATTAQEAYSLMEAVRQWFEKTEHHFQDTVFKKSFSCGIAAFPDFKSASELNDAADEALYKAKNGGRNCVKLAS